jgi:protein SCO1
MSLRIQWSKFLVLVALISVALLNGGCQAITSTYQYRGNPLDPPVSVPDFQLKTTDGSSFRLSDLKDKVALIFFGYTNCPDVCPLTVAEVKNSLSGLDEAERDKVQFIFISVDPERDTPEVLERYLSNFDPDFIGLTDDFEKVQEVMKPYWAYSEKEGGSETTDHSQHHSQTELPADYLVTHTGRIYLVTPAREMVLMYPFDFKAEGLRSDLYYLLEQQEAE